MRRRTTGRRTPCSAFVEPTRLRRRTTQSRRERKGNWVYRIIAASMRGLVSFLIALGVACAAAAQTPPAQSEAARGSALFQLRCADCHGVDAKGVHGPDLTVLFAKIG